MAVIERNTVNELYQDLLSTGWEHFQDDPSLKKEFHANDFPLISENLSEAPPLVGIQLRENQNGEYESDINNDYEEQIVVMRYLFPFSNGDTAKVLFETYQQLIFDSLDPNGHNAYRIFITLQEYGEQSIIQIDRVIMLPEDIEYINKSAEVHWQLGTALRLFCSTMGDDSYTYFLSGEKVESPLDWIFGFINKMHDLYPEFVWKMDEKNDETDNFAKLKEDAARGNMQAQFNLGLSYDFGEGVSQSHENAAIWYQKAAEQGHAEAARYLGASYRDGEGVPQDFEQAVYWYEKSAELGDADAQNFVGTLYYDGNGVPQDIETAVSLLERAAEQGYPGAAYNLGTWYVSGEKLPQDFVKAEYWWHKAADEGLDLAQYNLGMMNERGDGAPEDFEKAVHWYQQAAEQGHTDAQIHLRLLTKKG